ncbi:hypothetical protein PABG_03560 [Paracoccidioides brasiliensis Pb03]|nr:hypothetical protein PABG_03560 [Paracoccidioides brasiliensis Pb03]
MDPFSAEGELLNIHNAFHQGQYQEVIDFDSSTFSPENTLTARVLKLRAKIALGQTDDVLAEVEGEEDVPDLAAVKVLALQTAGDEAGALKGAEELVAKNSENATTQVLIGTVLQAQGKSEEALSLLSKHQGNLEAVALTVQIHLQQNRTYLAQKEIQAARRWAQDSLLVNLAESWIGLRVGSEKYQSAFYVYEELASNPNTSSPISIVGQAVSELHLGRLPEAEVALQSALERYPNDIQTIANLIVLNVLSGKDATELTSSLQKVQPDHPLLTDLAEKSAFFDAAASKYAAKVSS